MRELTDLEIEQFDFTGRVPELNMPIHQNLSTAYVKNPAGKLILKARPFAKLPRRKPRPQVGLVGTA